MTLLESVLNFVEKLCREAVNAELAKPSLTNRGKVLEYVRSLEYKLWEQKVNIFEYAFVQAENMLRAAADSLTSEEKRIVRERLQGLPVEYPNNAFVQVNVNVLLSNF